MDTIEKIVFEIGEKVTYLPARGDKEHGIVKSLNEFNSDVVFVVYNCNHDWDNYMNYTGCSTHKRDLLKGWR